MRGIVSSQPQEDIDSKQQQRRRLLRQRVGKAGGAGEGGCAGGEAGSTAAHTVLLAVGDKVYESD